MNTYAICDSSILRSPWRSFTPHSVTEITMKSLICVWTEALSGAGADPGTFLGGAALVSCSTSTPINQIVFFLQNTICIRKLQVISKGGGEVHTPWTLPLDPFLWCGFRGSAKAIQYSVSISLLNFRGFLYIMKLTDLTPLRNFWLYLARGCH